jgi:cytoskeletal protein RodZ
MLPDMTTGAIPPKELAAEKLRQRRLHVRKLRRTVVAIAVAVLVALWAVIFVQLVTGNDPVLAANAQAATSTGSTSSGVNTSSGGSSTGSSTSSESGSLGGGATTSVVTRQS